MVLLRGATSGLGAADLLALDASTSGVLVRDLRTLLEEDEAGEDLPEGFAASGVK